MGYGHSACATLRVRVSAAADVYLQCPERELDLPKPAWKYDRIRASIYQASLVHSALSRSKGLGRSLRANRVFVSQCGRRGTGAALLLMVIDLVAFPAFCALKSCAAMVEAASGRPSGNVGLRN